MATVRRASRIAVSALSIVAGLGAVATPVNANEAPEKREASKKRPVYVIAHGANDRASVDRAVEAGVNGVEIDICANKDYKGKGKGKGDAGAPSWYVDHDCKGPQGKPSLDDMFGKLAGLEAGKRPVVVWLDIKTPDECANSDDQCSTRVVAEKAKTLTKANINVLYDLTSENYAKNRSTLGAAGFKKIGRAHV